jgi:hypothetical protein
MKLQLLNAQMKKFMNKYNIINLYKDRAESFVKRTVAVLKQANITSGYDKELNKHFKDLVEAGIEGYDAADETSDFSASLADEYLLLNDGIYSAILTSYFHLWERDMKDLCKVLLRYRPVTDNNKDVTEKVLKNYKYEQIKSLLAFYGARESIFHKVDLLRLVVNTAKHSDGGSAKELLATNSKYYYKLAMLCGLPTEIPLESFDQSMLGVEDLKYFGVSLVSFWEELGKDINV